MTRRTQPNILPPKMNTDIASSDDSESDPDPPGTIAVEVSNTQSHLPIDRQALVRLVESTLLAEGVTSASISIAIVDDLTIRAINREHLDHDWPTDVISFPLSDPGDSGLSGELIVSGEMAANTATDAGVSAWDELALYVVHGLLHFCGYDDAEPGSRAEMRRREGELLAMSGRANTYTAALNVAASGARESAPWVS
jgi:probable rRNA maturation factor